MVNLVSFLHVWVRERAVGKAHTYTYVRRHEYTRASARTRLGLGLKFNPPNPTTLSPTTSLYLSPTNSLSTKTHTKKTHMYP